MFTVLFIERMNELVCKSNCTCTYS